MLLYTTLIYKLKGNVIPLISCLNFSSILFIIGLVGIIWNKKNILVMLFCIELMFFCISLNFVFYSIYTYQVVGQIYCLFIVTTAATETAIGLSLLVVISRLGNKINYNSLVTLRSVS